MIQIKILHLRKCRESFFKLSLITTKWHPTLFTLIMRKLLMEMLHAKSQTRHAIWWNRWMFITSPSLEAHGLPVGRDVVHYASFRAVCKLDQSLKYNQDLKAFFKSPSPVLPFPPKRSNGEWDSKLRWEQAIPTSDRNLQNGRGGLYNLKMQTRFLLYMREAGQL